MSRRGKLDDNDSEDKADESSKSSVLEIERRNVGDASSQAVGSDDSLEKDIKKIIEKLSPHLGPIQPGMRRKVVYESSTTSAEIRVPKDTNQATTSGKGGITKQIRKVTMQYPACDEGKSTDREQKPSDTTSNVETEPTVSQSTNDASPVITDATNFDCKVNKRPIAKDCDVDKSEISDCEISRVLYHDQQRMPGCWKHYQHYEHYDENVYEPKTKRFCQNFRDEGTHPSMHRHVNDQPCFERERFYRDDNNCEDSRTGVETVDRYNYNHKTITREKPGKFGQFFNRQPKKRSSSDSGITIPQLYKANVAKGPAPYRFTFKAVTGEPLFDFRSRSSIECADSRTEVQKKSGSFKRKADSGRKERQGGKEKHKAKQKSSQSECKTESVTESKEEYTKEEEEEEVYGEHRERRKVKAKPKPSNKHSNFSTNCRFGKYGDNLKWYRNYAPDIEKTRAVFEDGEACYISHHAVPDRMEVYCFDQLNTGYFRTSDHAHPLIADLAIECTQKNSATFWAEAFGFLHIVFAFILSFILQLFKFIFVAIIRPLLTGIIMLLSDYFFKPLLTVIYNGITQPLSIFLYNILSSLRDVCYPIAKGIGYFVELIAILIRSIRLVEVRNTTHIVPPSCQNQVV